MADFTLSKPIFGGKPKTSTAGNIAYALFVLFCFWAGSQLLNMLVHAPGVYEHLMQVQDNGRPRVEIGFGVSTLFGLVPFLAGCMILGVVALVLRGWTNRRIAEVHGVTSRCAPASSTSATSASSTQPRAPVTISAR